MANVLPLHKRFDLTDRLSRSLDDEIDRVMKDHYEVETCGQIEDLIESVLNGHQTISRLANVGALIQIGADSATFNEVEELIDRHFRRWLHQATRLNEVAQKFVNKGYEVTGLPKLLEAIDDIESSLSPSDTMTVAMEDLVEKTVKDVEAGKYTGWVSD